LAAPLSAGRSILARSWFLVLLTCVLVLGFCLPGSLESATRHVSLDVVVAVILFLMALALDSSSLRTALARPQAFLLGAAVNLGLAPPLAWLASQAFAGDLAIGLMVVGSVPCTLVSAVVWTRRAEGNDAVAMLVTLATNLACFAVTPLWLGLLTGRLVGGELSLERMVLKLGLTVAVPILTGQLLRRVDRLRILADRWKSSISVAAQIGVLITVFAGATHAGGRLRGLEDTVPSLVEWLLLGGLTISLHLALVGAGWLGGRWLGLASAERIAVAFSGAQKTLPIGLLVAAQFGGLVLLPMIVYHVVQLLLDTLIADSVRGKGGRIEDLGSSEGMP
jgi:solute carrier family 10 (sodium/bile acid cotransporter), member 7